MLKPNRERRNFKPANLAQKLRQLRQGLGLSQSEMVRCLDPEEIMQYGRISEYERGKREPSLWVLLAYARAACIHLECLVDDEIKLPATLPGSVIYPQRSHNQRLSMVGRRSWGGPESHVEIGDTESCSGGAAYQG